MNKLNVIEMDSAAGSDFIKRLLEENAVVPLCVTGSSMMPTLKPGRDSVLLEKCSEASFRTGQILLYERSDCSLVLHRIRKRQGEKLIMNGDSHCWCESIRREQAIACVSHIIRNDKRISCNCAAAKVWNILWYPTRILRPFLKRIRKVFNLRRKKA